MNQQENQKLQSKFPFFRRSAIILLFLDVLSIMIAWYGALWIRADFSIAHITQNNIALLNQNIIWFILVTILIYFMMKLYNSVWSFYSIHDALQVVYSYLILIPCYFIGSILIPLPKSIFLIAYIINLLFCIGLRSSYRILLSLSYRYGHQSNQQRRINTMVIGAGAAGSMLLRELIHSKDSERNVVCLIDDNPSKKGNKLNGISIIGGRDMIANAVLDYDIDEIIFAIPSISAKEKKVILEICKKTGCQLKSVPGINQLVNGEVHINHIRSVEIEDLLGREPIIVNNEEINNALEGRVVLVTGGGGSIGSELCRQIAKCYPKRLIILDIYENSAYAIQQELGRKYGKTFDIQVRIASVRNKCRIDAILSEFHPDVIYHAAAHKHVPLMEDSPTEAIKNNVFGTFNVAKSAAEHGVKRMLLISTDKAVNPTNIMGASKRLCEMVIQMMDRKYPDTCFIAVRFGNVLGSNGSVVPLFKKQIAEGGPVTVTDKRIIRYFMTIPEAVSLVLDAMHFAKGGEIFILDMGEPVSIDEMARNLIRLSGFEPDVDIPIIYTGLRPGEKLYEELLMDEEGMQYTENALIHIGQPIKMNDEIFITDLQALKIMAESESPQIIDKVLSMVPTYHPNKNS